MERYKLIHGKYDSIASSNFRVHKDCANIEDTGGESRTYL